MTRKKAAEYYDQVHLPFMGIIRLTGTHRRTFVIVSSPFLGKHWLCLMTFQNTLEEQFNEEQSSRSDTHTLTLSLATHLTDGCGVLYRTRSDDTEMLFQIVATGQIP